MNLHKRGLTRGQQTLIAVAVAVFTLLVMTGIASAKGSDAGLSQQATQPNGQKCANLFTVSPQAGPAGSKITITGTHWPANQQVGIFFVDAKRTLRPFNLGAPGILPNGSWRMTIVVPSNTTFAPDAGDEAVSSDPITQRVTAGNYMIYATTGDDQHGFGIDQVCPQKFAVTYGPVSSSDATGFSSDSGLWERLAIGLLVLLLLAVVVVVEFRRWRQQHKVGVVGIGMALLLVLGGIMLTVGSFSVQATSATPAAGSVLLTDDFSGDTVGSVPTGWTQETGTSWSVQVDGTNVLEQTSGNTATLYSIVAGSPGWTDYSISASVKPGPNSTINGSSVVAISGRHKDVNNFYTLLVKNGNAWFLGKKVNGTFTTLATGSTSYNTTTWYTWVLSMTGTSISASINGTTLATVTDGAFSSGNINLTTRAETEYDNVVVTTTGSAPTPTPTNTSVATATNTPPPTPTNTSVPTATNTPAPTATNTPTPTATDTPAATNTPGATATNTPTPTPTATNTPTPTPTPTNTPTPTPTATNTPTPPPTATPTPPGNNTLFSDDFEADTLGAFPPNWTLVSGTWVVQVDGTQVLKQNDPSTSSEKRVLAGSTSWTNYVFQVDVKPGANSVSSGLQIIARESDANNYYSFGLFSNTWYLKKKVGGTQTTITQGNFSYTSQFYTMIFSLQGTSLIGKINGTTAFSVTDGSLSHGQIALSTKAQSEFDNVFVTLNGAGSTPTPTPTPAPPTPTATATNTATPNPGGYGTVTGQVTDNQGNPVAGVQVSTIPTSTSTITDANGNYTLTNVGVGNVGVVVASASGFNATYVNATVTLNNTTVANEQFTAPIPANTSMDNYFRPDEPEWNPSSDGSTWLDDRTTYPGASTSVSNNMGFVDTFTAATDRDEWMGGTYADQLISADFEVLQFGQDAFQHGPRLLGRITDGHHFIDFAINYATSNLQLWSNKGEVWTLLAQVNVPKFNVNQWYHAKLLTVGTASFGKVWAFGASEPDWMISGTQAGLTTGMGGIRTTFADAYWDNFTVQAVTAITGKVSDSSGTAIANATVSDGNQSVSTDSSGRYVLIEPNQNATYTLTVSATGFTTQTASVNVTSLVATTKSFTLT
ncbi:MAG TPA: carboxypeptidase regulatory-like domain-containing protein [Ktedonobacterales bacterium]